MNFRRNYSRGSFRNSLKKSSRNFSKGFFTEPFINFFRNSPREASRKFHSDFFRNECRDSFLSKFSEIVPRIFFRNSFIDSLNIFFRDALINSLINSTAIFHKSFRFPSMFLGKKKKTI